MKTRDLRLLRAALVISTASFLLALPVSAATIWTDWTTATAGAPGSAAGTVSGVAVSYSGELDSAVTNGTSLIWAPNSSFVGGTSTASPSTVGDVIFLNGGFTGTNTITFDSPVTNPVFAIWSLGQPALPATFTFDATPTFEAGGPNANFGGNPITVSGNVVNGWKATASWNSRALLLPYPGLTRSRTSMGSRSVSTEPTGLFQSRVL